VIWAVALGAALAIACVLFVARPFLLDPEARNDRLDEPSELERRQIELLERRDRALGGLKELEFDHRSGKISDEDYRALVGPLRRQAAEALRALEPRAEVSAKPIRANRYLSMAIDLPTQPDLPEPYPPPGELDPPAPPQITEPYPPPDEADPPAPPQIPEPYPP
jgi:hypothetical protein